MNRTRHHLTSLLLTAALLCGSLLTTSCSTTGPGGEKVPSEYLQPAATIAAAVAIEQGKTDTARKKTAAKIVQISEAVALLSGTDTSGAEISAIVIQFGGNEPAFRALALTLTVLYDKYAPRYSGGEVFEIVNQIAKGLSAGASPYL